ncbi:hypothetical protein GCM10009839_46790 [Catenulispora yoronensis]|uniref:Cupin domain-containing protein n=1 Tax=Catenulispora yoronensis TaxID=450799 RepID=A0ABP5G3B5_9ACTN
MTTDVDTIGERIEDTSDTAALVVPRTRIEAITSVRIDGRDHPLGQQRDFRRHEQLAAFLPEHGRFSLAWVRLRDGECLHVHDHPTKSMILVCQGSVRLLGAEERELTEGDAVCVEPGVAHGFATRPGEEFHGLSVQFEGAGLYEDPAAPRAQFHEHAPRATHIPEHIRELLLFNEGRIGRLRTHRMFEAFDDGRAAADPLMRDRFTAALHIWSVYFQRMLYARQEVCVDPRLRDVYAAHLSDEFGHDTLLKDGHGVTATVYDPILEAVGSWFVMRMHGSSEAARIVIVHQALESSCQVFGERIAPAFAAAGHGESSYFDLHADVDQDHRLIGFDHLCATASAELPDLLRVCEETWDQIELLYERLAIHMLG